jgi:hypothetical protein
MAVDVSDPKWLLFVSQLPASPSSLRVMVWRRMRASGALGLQNGVWVFPHRQEHERFLQELLKSVENQQGKGQIFIAQALGETIDEQIIARFRAERNQEYAEFSEQCASLQQEIDKETRRKKFTFAELEENESNLERLSQWLAKIKGRDFFAGDRLEQAVKKMETCRKALASFADRVYSHDGVQQRAGHEAMDSKAQNENKSE